MEKSPTTLAAVEYAIAKAEGDTLQLHAELHAAEAGHESRLAGRITKSLDRIERRVGRLRAMQRNLLRVKTVA